MEEEGWTENRYTEITRMTIEMYKAINVHIQSKGLDKGYGEREFNPDALWIKY